MNHINLQSNSGNDTIKIANRLAKYLKCGDTIILIGDLGAGKTKFTEGFLSYYNLQNEISSPTFNIVNEYHSTNITIFHFDVYRLENSDEFYEIGGDEYFEKGICLIEWGEIIKDALPNEFIKIEFEKDSNNVDKRIIKISSFGNKYDTILDKLKKEIELEA